MARPTIGDAPMSARERQQRRRAKLKEEARNKVRSQARSWRVEAIAKDGKRYGNGVRLRTEAEADAYRWHAVGHLRHFIISSTLVLPCEDRPNAKLRKNRKNEEVLVLELGARTGEMPVAERAAWTEVKARHS